MALACSEAAAPQVGVIAVKAKGCILQHWRDEDRQLSLQLTETRHLHGVTAHDRNTVRII